MVADVCVYLHVERLVRGVELKAAIDVGGATTWAEGRDDWWYEVDQPFERSRWSWRSGELAIDLKRSSTLAPVDHAAVLATLELPGSEGDHYVAVGR